MKEKNEKIDQLGFGMTLIFKGTEFFFLVIFWNLKKVDSKFFLILLSKKKCMHEKFENEGHVKSGVIREFFF